MQKDLKFGMILGLIVMIAVLFWLSTRPSLSPKSRMLQAYSTHSADKKNAAAQRQPTDTLLSLPENLRSQVPSGNSLDSAGLAEPEKIKTTRFHIVRRGETLSGISHRYYGSPNKWRNLLAANRSCLEDPNKLRPGMKLIIPD